MDWVLLLGRILFAFLFIQAGIGFHLRQRVMAAGYAKAMGLPAPELAVVVSGVQIVVAGVLIVLGTWVDLAALLVVAFLVPTNYWMHAFWKMDEPDQKLMNKTHFWKNTALIGGALILFYLYQQFGDETRLNLGPPSLFG